MRKLSTLIPVLALVALLLGLTLAGGARAAGTSAGTVITNVATASATLLDGTPVSAQSDPVTTVVGAVCAVSVTPDGTPERPGQSANVLPGERAVFAYAVLNAGNQEDTFGLSGVTDPGSAFTPGLVAVYQDDGSGTLAPGAQPIIAITLKPDASAKLLMVVQTAGTDRGSAFVSLNAACGQAAGGSGDTNNYAAVNVGQPAALSLSKAFSPAQVRPGEGSGVTLTVRNSGAGESREVVVTDPLNTPELAGASFVAGSASASLGTLEYSADGSTFTATPSGPVAAIRLRLPSLAPGQSASLSFQLKTDPAFSGTLQNRATARSSGVADASASASLDVRFTPGVALGPIGNPAAPEGSDQDRQGKDFAVVGQALCFAQTVQNTGDVADDYTLNPNLTAGQADLSLRAADGSTLASPVHLEPGQRLDFQVCLTPQGTGPVTLVLTATGTRGSANRTTDTISRIESRLPELHKTVDPSGQVTVGQALSYTLTVHNPYDRALSGVVVRDPLSASLDFVSASDGGSVQGGAVVWTLGTLAPGETRVLTLKATVGQAARDGEIITNSFTLSGDQFPAPIDSPSVGSPVWSAALAVVKSVSPLEATVGDRLDYTVRVRNLSQGGALSSLTVTDTLPAGVTYIPGSARQGGQPLADPQIAGRVLTWQLADLAPQGEAVLTYAVRVSAEASGELVNVVSVNGQGANGAVVASNEAKARLKLRPGLFAPLSEIVGVVFVDRNRDGVYQAGIDTPVERARIVLADGRLALTDAQGRYHFADVPEGFTALRLDPASVPYHPLSVPQDGGRPGSRGVTARGLVSVDFPLAALIGEVGAIRETTLRDGPLTVTKQLSLLEDGSYLATLTLSANGPVGPFHLDDPLPAGARLIDGQNTLDVGELAPAQTLHYRFAFDGPAERAVTDPTVTWRKP